MLFFWQGWVLTNRFSLQIDPQEPAPEWRHIDDNVSEYRLLLTDLVSEAGTREPSLSYVTLPSENWSSRKSTNLLRFLPTVSSGSVSTQTVLSTWKLLALGLAAYFWACLMQYTVLSSLKSALALTPQEKWKFEGQSLWQQPIVAPRFEHSEQSKVRQRPGKQVQY